MERKTFRVITDLTQIAFATEAGMKEREEKKEKGKGERERERERCTEGDERK